jgi:hypothetical protein
MKKSIHQNIKHKKFVDTSYTKKDTTVTKERVSVFLIVSMVSLFTVPLSYFVTKRVHEMFTLNIIKKEVRQIVREEMQKQFRKEFGPFPEWTRQTHNK